MKEITELALKMTEEEYRGGSAYHYSTIARYDREGFAGLPHLFDKQSSPSLTFGSMVDTMLTDGIEEYNKRFVVLDIPSIPDRVKEMVQCIYNEQKDILPSLISAPEEMLLEYCQKFDYCQKFKPKTQIENTLKKGAPYYNALKKCEGKEIVTLEQHNDCIRVINALKEGKESKFYFAKDNPFTPEIKRYYQPIFKATLGVLDYVVKFDLLVVNYREKVIIPCDLKTTGKPEYEFAKSFIQWGYQIQARLYSRVLKKVLSESEDFKDFTIAPFRFIVVNKNTLNPMIWKFADYDKVGDLTYGDTTLKDPETIANELNYYLKNKPAVPIGIEGVNELTNFLGNI